MRTIEKIYEIGAPIAEVWRALTDPLHIDEWGGGPAQMADRAGTEFQLWGGDIHGRNIEVEPPAKLVQEWYAGDWPVPSIATFTLSDEQGTTRLALVHTGVPEDEADDIDEGWDMYYLGPMKELLES